MANIGFDKAETEPSNICQHLANLIKFGKVPRPRQHSCLRSRFDLSSGGFLADFSSGSAEFRIFRAVVPGVQQAILAHPQRALLVVHLQLLGPELGEQGAEDGPAEAAHGCKAAGMIRGGRFL